MQTATFVSEADATSFVRARPRLVVIARQVLGDADAEDVVQDAWMRWHDTDRAAVRDPTAFLATTTRRLALNVGQSARARRELCGGPRLSETADPSGDPALGPERDEALVSALRRTLETLSGAERAAYLLREGFDYPHRRIARVLGLSEANARQVVARARRRLEGGRRRRVGAGELERLVDAFAAAARHGDLAGLERELTQGTGEVAA
jgi:RNA polymerase sigma-70 factor (ECF subfamily)